MELVGVFVQDGVHGLLQLQSIRLPLPWRR
jgi:hypothetical protein